MISPVPRLIDFYRFQSVLWRFSYSVCIVHAIKLSGFNDVNILTEDKKRLGNIKFDTS